MEQKYVKNQGTRKAVVGLYLLGESGGTFCNISAIWPPSQVPLDGRITDSYRKVISRTAAPPKPSLCLPKADPRSPSLLLYSFSGDR